MIVQCPQCQARYRLPEESFAGRSEVQVRCTGCRQTFPVSRNSGHPDSAAVTDSPPPGPRREAEPSTPPELPAEMSVALSVTQGPLKGQVFPVTKPRVVVGRSDTDIVVNDHEVSRRHCALEIHGPKAMLRDLGSTNGTFVEEERIETHNLGHLDEFRIGSTTLMFTVVPKN